MNLLHVSFPRSGNQFLVNCLRSAIGERLRWCEGYTTQFDPAQFNMLKTHDFHLTAKPPDGWGTIVQLRNPLDALPSWFNVQNKYGQPDTYESWREWSRTAIIHWSKFVRKWVLNSHPDLVILHYDLQRHAANYIEHIAWLLTGESGHRAAAIENRPASVRWEFRYFKEDDFRFLESLCLAEMRLLGYRLDQ